jgi:hypothetical protein
MVSDKKEQKFKRIAPKRLANFKLSADRLSKCLNKAYFDYTDEEKQYINEEVNKTINKLFNH